MKNENKFQGELIKELKNRFPGCYVLKNDAGYMAGIPDLSVLYKDHWAMLEVKRSKADMEKSKRKQQDQAYHVNRLNDMGYASYIYPENKEEVLNDLCDTFGLARAFDTESK